MGTQGWSQTTVRGVCREASLTPRFFYESFEDLDTLAVAVLDDIIAGATEHVIEAIAAAPPTPADQARAAIGSFVCDLTDDPRRARVAFVEALGSEAMMRRRLQAMRDVAGLIAEYGRLTYQPPPEAETLVELTAALMAGGVAELLITWQDGGLDISRDQLIEDCAELFVAVGDSAARIGAKRAARA
jgi:AcrR family transcriptional regulator